MGICQVGDSPEPIRARAAFGVAAIEGAAPIARPEARALVFSGAVVEDYPAAF